MSLITENTGRQAPALAFAEFDHGDIANTNFVPVFHMTDDMVPLRGYLLVKDAFDTSLTFNVGTNTTGNKYGNGLAGDSTGIKSLTMDGLVVDGNQIGLTASAVPTQGSGVLVIEYYSRRRADFSEG